MHAATTGFAPPARSQLRQTLRALRRGAAIILCLSVIAVLAVGTRHLVFEYNHGDRQVVQRLVASLIP
jgi:hypothetical protein